MKTRILSGAVLVAVVGSILTVGLLWEPLVITAFLAVLAGIGTYEMLHNVAEIREKTVVTGAILGSALSVIVRDEKLADRLVSLPALSFWNAQTAVKTVTVTFFLFAVCCILKNHKTFSLARIVTFCAMPLVIAYGFSCLGGMILGRRGIYYLLLLLNASSICDTGAYFTGVSIGRHKLCPEISPKKTVEGAIGGIVSSLIIGCIIVWRFGNMKHAVTVLPLTVVLCVVGMLGDLFASAFKRAVGLKDYGNLIPGHGGVLDRFDSMLLIAPVMSLFIAFGVLG